MNSEQVHEPVTGEIIWMSKAKTFGFAALMLFLGLLGVGLDYLWWNDTVFAGKKVTWWGAIIGLLMIVVGLVGPPVILWQCFVRKQRLILGEKLIQVVVSKGGDDLVQVQIPFSNIASASIEKENESTVVAIRLRETDEPQTYNADPTAFAGKGKRLGWNFSIDNHYQIDPEELVETIRTRIPAD